MASIRKYRDKWRAEVQRNGVRASYVASSKREAQAWALAKEAELDAQKGPGGQTFRTAVEKYHQSVSSAKSQPQWERRRLETFAAHFGDATPIGSITSGSVGEWRDTRRMTVSGSTVNREANLLRNLFTVACDEWRWIDRNPFKGVRMPDEAQARHQLWRWQQIKRVLRCGREGKTGEVVRAFRIALHTALRLSEVLDGAYDPKARVMTLAKTKTGGRVEVPIPARAAKLLPDTFSVGANEASTLFSKLCRELMIKDLHFHDARATALTLLAKRVDVMVLARISRHKDISLLHRVYYRETASEIAARI